MHGAELWSRPHSDDPVECRSDRLQLCPGRVHGTGARPHVGRAGNVDRVSIIDSLRDFLGGRDLVGDRDGNRDRRRLSIVSRIRDLHARDLLERLFELCLYGLERRAVGDRQPPVERRQQQHLSISERGRHRPGEHLEPDFDGLSAPLRMGSAIVRRRNRRIGLHYHHRIVSGRRDFYDHSLEGVPLAVAGPRARS